MASVESRLAAIEAKDEIRELTARYCHAVVDGDAKAIVELFCDDGVFRAHTSAPEGREDLKAFYAAGVGAKTANAAGINSGSSEPAGVHKSSARAAGSECPTLRRSSPDGVRQSWCCRSSAQRPRALTSQTSFAARA